jgi:penicillin amidase/acyl-homoserine-lactone acylase
MIMRYVKWAFYGVGALFLVVFSIAYLTLPNKANTAPFLAKAQTYDLEILRDGLGIPHVYGKKDVDTAFGLGYVQSEDDFSTLQSVILATRGRLAAQVGSSAAQGDFVVQFMGVWDTVNAQYESKVPAHIQQIAQAYADGVNLYAAQNIEQVSRYLLPVTAKDVIAGFTFKNPMFYGFDKVLGDVVNPDAPHEFARLPEAETASVFNWQAAQNLPIGSQGIAIAPHRSSDGLTHLLVNSHQPLRGPVAWYEARLHSEEGWNMVGSTFPGAPLIVHGHNQHLGWSNTVNKPDLVDIYQLRINPENEDQYLLDGEWLDFETKTARMLVKLLGPIRWTFTRDIKISKHGPVMQTEQGAFALRWAGMNEVRILEFMFKANKATNKNEFEAALALNAMPSINFVYADKDGNIAHYYNAKFPKRIEGWEWGKILPGDRSELIWQTYRDFASMPKTINPQSGMVYNANHPPWFSTDGDDDPKLEDFAPSMGIETFVTNRALQIESLLKEQERISFDALRAVKYDLSYHPKSHQIKRLMLWLSEQDINSFEGNEAEGIRALQAWNLSTHKENTESALAILTMGPIQKARGEAVDSAQISAAFSKAIADLVAHHGSVRVPHGEVFRLKQGNKNLAVSGGPDVLRAMYGNEMDENGQIEIIAGDGFMMFVAWDKNGVVHSQAVHQYGSATLDEDSVHFNDQMGMFTEHEERKVLLQRSELEVQVTRRYRPGSAEARKTP